MTPRALGAVLRETLNSEAGLEVARQCLADSWTCGACDHLAIAIWRWLGDIAEPVALMRGGRFEHAAAKVGDYFLDGDGASTEDELLDRWGRKTRAGALRVEPLDVASCPPEDIDAIVRFLEENMGHGKDVAAALGDAVQNPPSLEGVFTRVLSRASQALPWLAKVELRYCAAADRDHKRSWRQFAHTGCKKGTVCFARAAEEELTYPEKVGMTAHELGHVVGDALDLPAHSFHRATAGRTPQAVQDEADEVARRFFGIEIRYNKRTLQEAVL